MVKKRTLSDVDSMNTECIIAYLAISSSWGYSYWMQDFNQKESEACVRFCIFVWYISIVHLFSSVNIMFAKSVEVLHLFPRQTFLRCSVRSVFQTYKKWFSRKKITPLTYFATFFLLLWTPLSFVELPLWLFCLRPMLMRGWSCPGRCVVLLLSRRRRWGNEDAGLWKGKPLGMFVAPLPIPQYWNLS